jgi:hypothetical protein
MYEIIWIPLVVGGIVAIAVWLDAYNRNDDNGTWWALGTFLILIVALPLYLYHRAHGTESVVVSKPETVHVAVEGAKSYAVECRCGRPIVARAHLGEHLKCRQCGREYVAGESGLKIVT